MLSLLKRIPISAWTRPHFTPIAYSTGALTRSYLFPSSTMEVVLIPCLEDNYSYLVVDPKTREGAVVDPVEPEKVMSVIEESKVDVKSILTTHHHWDHAGGNVQMKQLLPKAKVFGGDDRIDALTDKVVDGDSLTIGSLNVSCLFTPCHTAGHICYHVYETGNEGTGSVFTGDTLFVGGCGRFFEGTGEQMCSALLGKLGKLPEATSVYCGHEYTTSNYKFAEHVEPDNQELKKRYKWAKEQREKNAPTIPSTIGIEKQTNPFMRVEHDSLQAFTKAKESTEVMTKLRVAKDSFK
eukprot:Nk52_evm54s1810 gene=Nk52_evmTU54s1810